MRSEPMQRPSGFRASEVTSLVNDDVVAQHAEDAAFLWSQRRRAVHQAHYNLADLSRLDERVEAHVAGLRVAGPVGWQLCLDGLDDASPAEIFVASAVALTAGTQEVDAAVEAAIATPIGHEGLVSALGWVDGPVVQSTLATLVDSAVPLRRAAGIAGYAIRRLDPGVVLTAAIEDAEAGVRARALRAAGELRRHDLLAAVISHLAEGSPACRFWAAWSATLLRSPHGHAALHAIVPSSSPFSELAVELAFRTGSHLLTAEALEGLRGRAGAERLAVQGAGALGDPANIPWLLDQATRPSVSRLAGEAFCMITGVDLVEFDLEAPAEAEAESTEPSDDEDLPRPAPERLERWWSDNRQRFKPGVRHLLGHPITVEVCRKALTWAKQRQRAAGALELALLAANNAPLFEVRARGRRQREQLARQHSS